MSNDGRRPRASSRELPLATEDTLLFCSESDQPRSSDVSSRQHLRAQDVVVRGPRTPKKRKDPRHILPLGGEETRLLRVYSNRENIYIEVNVTVVNDIEQCWISEDMAEKLQLKRKPNSKDDEIWGYLGLQTFEFMGTVTLQWKRNNNSEATKARIVPRKEFEIYLPSNMLPPPSSHEEELTVLDPISTSLSSGSNETSPTVFTGQFDGEELDAYLENSNEAKSANEWMLEMEKVHDRKPQGYVRDSYKSIKIAVLDTGIDWKHSSMRAAKKQNRLKALKSFVKGDESVDDLHGHGTHVAALLLKVAPDSQLYIAKVASGGKIPADHNIADALKWAIECDIDIITMSFGIDRDHVAMQDQIREAYHKDIIMFAAASNRGHNYPVPFPARRSEVLCIYATDGKGYPYNGNPSLETADCHFATLGVAVKSAWPEHLLPDHPSDRSGERRMTGTSLATPIVAGIAAYILDFAHVQEIDDDSYRMLRSRDGMKKIFSQLLVTKNDGLDYIHPWKLFTDYRTEDSDVLFLIKDTLAQWVGSPKSAELCD